MSEKTAERPKLTMDSDVYETSDLPEADQNMMNYEETTDSVETLQISANEAFGKFKGKCLDSNNVDFSDRLRNSRRKGYIVWSGEDSEPKPEETPVKKYQRLNCEVRELLDQISEAKRSKSSGLEENTLQGVTSQVQNLHKVLMELRLEEVLGQEVVDTMTNPQAASRKKLLSQLDELKTDSSTAKKSNTANNKTNVASKDGFSYELFIKPETSALRQEAIVANLESRLAIIEQAIGYSKENMSTLSMETNQKTIGGAVNVLTAKTALLDPNNLDHVEGRLAALQQKLARLAESTSSLDTTDHKSKLEELLSIATQSNTFYTSLPDLIDRMEALQTIHSQAGDFSGSLVELEAVQQQMVVEVGNNSSLLKETQDKFKQNLANIQANFGNLDARLEALGKK